jgi:hypothetical protein
MVPGSRSTNTARGTYLPPYVVKKKKKKKKKKINRLAKKVASQSIYSRLCKVDVDLVELWNRLVVEKSIKTVATTNLKVMIAMILALRIQTMLSRDSLPKLQYINMINLIH